jgi:hypothetical protein
MQDWHIHAPQTKNNKIYFLKINYKMKIIPEIVEEK